MALRGTDVNFAALKDGSCALYLNEFRRTKAWLGPDHNSYRPGDEVTGRALLRHNAQYDRRDLVLTQVDVYLSPECARRKRNVMYDTRSPWAKQQNLADFFCVRNLGFPTASHTYKAYYNYGETVCDHVPTFCKTKKKKKSEHYPKHVFVLTFFISHVLFTLVPC